MWKLSRLWPKGCPTKHVVFWMKPVIKYFTNVFTDNQNIILRLYSILTICKHFRLYCYTKTHSKINFKTFFSVSKTITQCSMFKVVWTLQWALNRTWSCVFLTLSLCTSDSMFLHFLPHPAFALYSLRFHSGHNMVPTLLLMFHKLIYVSSFLKDRYMVVLCWSECSVDFREKPHAGRCSWSFAFVISWAKTAPPCFSFWYG